MQVTYNGIILPYSDTSSFKQTSVYDESNTDRILTRIEITTQCLVNINYVQLLAADLNNKTGNAASIMKVIRNRLLAQRKTLSAKVSGVEMIPRTNTGTMKGTVDAKNGPQPQSCDIIRFNSETFIITFQVVAHYWESFDVGAGSEITTTPRRPGPILYNRWSEEVVLDETGFTKKVRSGKYMIRSDNPSGSLADDLRSQLAVLSVQPGFVRESSKYKVSPDGLAIEYTLTDREVFRYPPPGAYKAEGWTRESCGHLAVKRFAEVYTKVVGPNPVNKLLGLEYMARLSIGIVMRKLRAMGAAIGAGNTSYATVESASIKVEHYTNSAECYIKARYLDSNRRISGIGLNLRGLPEVPLSDGTDGAQPTYQDRGWAGLLLHAATYNDPSFVNPLLVPRILTTADNPDTTTNSNKTQMNTGVEPGQAGLLGG